MKARTKLVYNCNKNEDFNYGTGRWQNKYSRSYDMVVTAITELQCQRLMSSFENYISEKEIQDVFESNDEPHIENNKWVGSVEIYISNDDVTSEKELIKEVYAEWKESLKNKTVETNENQGVKMEMEIKQRTTTRDMLREQMRLESNNRLGLEDYDSKTGKASAVLDSKTTILFNMDSNYKITVTGGDRIAYGEWYDLEKDDEHLIKCAKELQDVLFKIKEKNITLEHEGIYKVYPLEASEIIENPRSILGKFYEIDCNVVVGIDNSTGECWVTEFKSLKKCIDWLNGEEEEKIEIDNVIETTFDDGSNWIEYNFDGKLGYELTEEYQEGDEEKIQNLIDNGEFDTKKLTEKMDITSCSKYLAEIIEKCRRSENEMYFVEFDELEEDLDTKEEDIIDNFLFELQEEVEKLKIDEYITFKDEDCAIIVWGGAITKFLFGGEKPSKEEESWVCHKCGEVENPTISVTIIFNDGETFDKLTDLDEEDDIEQYVKELVKENGWEKEYKDYSYGYFCPQCLNSLG